MSQREKPVVIGVNMVRCNGVQRLDKMASERDAITTTFSNGDQRVTCDALRDITDCFSANRGRCSCLHYRAMR